MKGRLFKILIDERSAIPAGTIVELVRSSYGCYYDVEKDDDVYDWIYDFNYRDKKYFFTLGDIEMGLLVEVDEDEE